MLTPHNNLALSNLKQRRIKKEKKSGKKQQKKKVEEGFWRSFGDLTYKLLFVCCVCVFSLLFLYLLFLVLSCLCLAAMLQNNPLSWYKRQADHKLKPSWGIKFELSIYPAFSKTIMVCCRSNLGLGALGWFEFMIDHTTSFLKNHDDFCRRGGGRRS